MPVDRLPASTQLLLSELLDLEVGAAAAAAVPLPVKGSFVTKTVRGRTYWYLQRVEGARTRQHYLGPDSVELRRWVEKASAARADREPDDAVRRRLCAMLAAGGALTEPAAVLRVVELLADAGVFRLGGVLVGTFGFRVLGNLLGVRLAGAHLRTDDLGIAQEPGVDVAVDPTVVPRDVPAAFRETDPPLLPVPGLLPRSPSTTFRARGRELRVDFLAPGPWRGPYSSGLLRPLRGLAMTGVGRGLAMTETGLGLAMTEVGGGLAVKPRAGGSADVPPPVRRVRDSAP